MQPRDGSLVVGGTSYILLKQTQAIGELRRQPRRGNGSQDHAYLELLVRERIPLGRWLRRGPPTCVYVEERAVDCPPSSAAANITVAFVEAVLYFGVLLGQALWPARHLQFLLPPMSGSSQSLFAGHCSLSSHYHHPSKMPRLPASASTSTSSHVKLQKP